MSETAGGRQDGSELKTEEVISVLSHYDIGETRSIRVYFRGSSKSPKALIESDTGKFILKRRGPGRDDPRRIVYEHAVHDQLRDSGYPVVEIMHSSRSKSKVVRASSGIYELFRYVKASRCEGNPVSVKCCGEALSLFHEKLMEFDEPSPPVRGFHAITDIQQHIERYAKTHKSRGRRACRTIIDYYMEAAQKVDQMGWDQWPKTVVHGDWHPGNVLFGEDGDVLAVLDFDAVRWETRTSDIASAILHFGRYVSALRTDEASTWPVNVDASAACALMKGYISKSRHLPTAMEIAAIPSLIIEALVMETMPVLIQDGQFAHMDALSTLTEVVSSIERIRSDSGRLISSLGAIVK
ncbi:MAG: phosphotransferase [Phycisphaerales bacterium]|nr:phosphotransferase [Phycisphaerales bacterium]